MRVMQVHESRSIWGAGGPLGFSATGDGSSGSIISQSGITNIGPSAEGVKFSIGSMTVTQGLSTNDSIAISVTNGTTTCGIVGTAETISASCNDGTSVSCSTTTGNCSVGSNGGDW